MTRRLLLTTLALIASAVSLHAQNITLFGNSATNQSAWAYDPSTSTISGTEGFADNIFGTSNSISIGSNRYISLTGTASIAPVGSFRITIEDNTGHDAYAQFTWTDFSHGTATSIKALNFSTFDFNNIVSWSLDSGGSLQTLNASFSQASAVAAIPEPSTAFMGLAGLVVVAFSLRRRLVKKAVRV